MNQEIDDQWSEIISNKNMIVFIPHWFLFTLLILSSLLILILGQHLSVGCYHALRILRQKTKTNHRIVLNLYVFHHLSVSIIRSTIILLNCLFILINNQCLSLEFVLHFLLLLSTFDILLIIIGEAAHFWDTTINRESTLYSKCFLIFGLCLIYFVSSLFLAIHITMDGDNPLIVNICKAVKRKLFVSSNGEAEQSIIPTMILYTLFILLNFLTLLWIRIIYRDIAKLKRKRLATVFFYSLTFTKYKQFERSKMVNQTLKRLRAVCLLVLSNIIAILPILTIKIFNIQLNRWFHLFLIYLTILPWCESIIFLFFEEMRYRSMRTNFPSQKKTHLQQIVGTRLSAYRDSRVDVQLVH